jgi:WD40 repeat protein
MIAVDDRTTLQFYPLAELTDKTAPITRTDHGADILDYAALITPNGRWLATGHPGGKVFLWDLQAGNDVGAPIELQEHDEDVGVLAVTPDSSTLIGIGTGMKDRSIVKWDLTSENIAGSAVELDTLPYEARMAVVTRGGGLITAAKMSISQGIVESYPVEVRSLDGGAPTSVLKNGNVDDITALILSADQSRLATGSDDASIRIWSLGEPGDPLILRHQLEAGDRPDRPHVEWLTFVGGNRWLVSGGFDGSLLLWDCQSPTTPPLEFFHGDNQAIVSMLVSPDQRWLLCCIDGGNTPSVIRVWDLLWMQVIKRARAELKVGSAPRVEA